MTKIVRSLWFIGLTCLAATAWAVEGGKSVATTLDAADVAANIVGSFSNIALLITAASYLAGLGFCLGAIMKFKQHKDNPTQIPIGTPIGLSFVAAALLFFPSLLGTFGVTMFGTEASVAGPGGKLIGTPQEDASGQMQAAPGFTES